MDTIRRHTRQLLWICHANIGDEMMPLPNVQAESPRVYKLLKNTTLANLTDDDLASVGNPITVEMLNEDELQRLCLVAFARMVTKGSFNGWL